MAHNDQIPFTFGVELEFIFGILQSSVPDAGDNEIYPTWGIDNWLAPVVVEHMRQRGVYPLIAYQDDTSGYLEWFVDYDMSCSLEKGQLGDAFPDDPRLDFASDHTWFHDGMELISKVMQLPELVPRGIDNDHSLLEVRKHLDSLVSSNHDDWFARTTEQCGLHVHIGVSKYDSNFKQIPLNILQHLAYILVEYEGVISCLHHPKRRGFYKSSTYVGTNKIGVNQNLHVCNQYNAATDEIRDQIFREGMTERDLADLMGELLEPHAHTHAKRYKFVNWELIRQYNNGSHSGSDREKPPTLEFRQHHGTLDYNDVSQWIRFLTALVRVAERRAKEGMPLDSPSFPSIPRSQLTFPQREGRKYRFRCARFQNRLLELFDLLSLDRLQQQYWERRLRKYNAHVFIRKPYTGLCVSCRRLNELTDPKQYLRFCKSLERIDASIDEERRSSGNEGAAWTEEDDRRRDERIDAAASHTMSHIDIDDEGRDDDEAQQDNGLHVAGAIRRLASNSRTTPYTRGAGTQSRRSTGRNRSNGDDSGNGSSQGGFNLAEPPKRRRRLVRGSRPS